MLIDTKQIKEALYPLKQESRILLDKAIPNRVRSSIEARVFVIDKLLIWLDQSEKQGELNMEELKLGEMITWEPKKKPNGIDEKIIWNAQNLKKNKQGIRVTVAEVKWTTFSNRVYALAKAKKISDHIVPRKDEDGTPVLVYLDDIQPKRRK